MDDVNEALDVLRDFVARAQKTQEAIDDIVQRATNTGWREVVHKSAKRRRKRRSYPNRRQPKSTMGVKDVLNILADDRPRPARDIALALGVGDDRAKKKKLSVHLHRAKKFGWASHKPGKTSREGGKYALTAKGHDYLNA